MKTRPNELSLTIHHQTVVSLPLSIQEKMALKLKLKMSSSSASGSPQPNANSHSNSHVQSPLPNQNQPQSPDTQPKLPKLKIKAPSKTPSTSESTPKISIKRPASNPIENGEKPKKLKLSLSKAKENGGKAKGLPRVRVKPTRVPGEGYDSEAPDLEDDPLIEQGIIIRFLNDVNLDFVHNAVDSGDLTGLNVKWVTKEKAVVKVNDTLYSARLIDLPTITEIFKTIDRKNVFKTFDVCQILLVLHPVEPAKLSIDKDFEVPEEFLFNHPFYKYVKGNEIKRKHYVHKDGLLQPFQDVYRRFRPTRADHRVILDIESRVDELIKLDNEADESHFELLDSRTAQQTRFGSHSANASVASTPTATRMDEPELTPVLSGQAQYTGGEYEDDEDDEEDESDGIEDDLELHLEQELEKALDSELSDSEVTIPTLMAGILQNDVEGEEVEVTVDENGNRIISEEKGDEEEREQQDDEDEEEEEEEEDEEEEEEEEEDDEEEVSGKQHAKLLEEEIAELEKAVSHHKKNLATASSKMLRMKFQNTYSSLKASLDLKKRDLTKLLEEQEQVNKLPSVEDVPARNEDENQEAEAQEDDDEQVDDDDEDREDDDGDNIDDIDDLF